MTTPANTNGNKPDVFAMVSDLGEQAGKGVDVQIKFFIAVTEAAFLNVINTDPDKHGKGVTDAVKVSDVFAKAQGKSSIFSTKAAAKTISVSKLAIRLGMFPHGGPGEPLNTLNNLITIWRKLRADPANKGTLVDAFNAASKFAREQLKRKTMISDAELRGYCFKPTKEEVTDEDFLAALRRVVLKRSSADACSDIAIEAFKAVAQTCTKGLTAIAMTKAPQSGMATPSAKSTVAPPTMPAATTVA